MPERISPTVNRLAECMATVDEVGRILTFDPRHRDDVAELLISEIGGKRVLRAWWIGGPRMTANWLTPTSPQHVNRTWTYQIHGVEGLAPAYDGDIRVSGEEIQTLRDKAVAVCDAIDCDTLDVGGTAFSSSPCQFRDQPRHATFLRGQLPLAYVVLEKVVQTMPNRGAA